MNATPPLPAPLTTSECDLRGYDFMPLFGHRLFGSEFYDKASGNEFRAAIKLWWTAWLQCPAGSLPNDDNALCRYADLGRDLRTWKRIKAKALHGFKLCSDGRLYHEVLCAEAQLAFERRRKDRARKQKNRVSLPENCGNSASAQTGQAIEILEDTSPNSAGQDADVTPDSDVTVTKTESKQESAMHCMDSVSPPERPDVAPVQPEVSPAPKPAKPSRRSIPTLSDKPGEWALWAEAGKFPGVTFVHTGASLSKVAYITRGNVKKGDFGSAVTIELKAFCERICRAARKYVPGWHGDWETAMKWFAVDGLTIEHDIIPGIEDSIARRERPGGEYSPPDWLAGLKPGIDRYIAGKRKAA